MIFTAILKAHSALHRLWRQQKRVGGMLGGVYFKLRSHRYVTDELNNAEVAALLAHDQVHVEAIGTEPVSESMSSPEPDASQRVLPRQVGKTK